jgi:hypothetical protein
VSAGTGQGTTSLPPIDSVPVPGSAGALEEDVGPADWIGLAGSVEPFFELRLPDGGLGVCFVSNFDQADTMQRVTVAGVGAPRFGRRYAPAWVTRATAPSGGSAQSPVRWLRRRTGS